MQHRLISMNMNQPDTSYWLNLAAQWIQSKSQTQLSFPNYPFSSSHAIPTAPSPPRFTVKDATAHDDLVEADMEIDDVKEEEPAQIWENWQQSNSSSPIIQTVQPQQLPVVESIQGSPKLHHHKHHSNKSGPKFVQIPSAPKIGQISESSQSIDMILDSDEEDNSSAIIEAQKRKKLPLWIREGLERLEREKKLEEVRLQKEKELNEDAEIRKKIMEEALKELEREKAAKSKYVSKVRWFKNDFNVSCFRIQSRTTTMMNPCTRRAQPTCQVLVSRMTTMHTKKW